MLNDLRYATNNFKIDRSVQKGVPKVNGGCLSV